MEVLGFLKFWKPGGKSVSDSILVDHDIVEGDDSFFELELSISDSFMNPQSARIGRFDSSIPYGDEQENEVEKSGRVETVFSKNKVIPVETSPRKAQSPINILKSAPKLRAFSLKKSKSSVSEKQKRMESKARKEDGVGDSREFFSAASFKRSATTSGKESYGDNLASEDYHSSKRFSKEGVQRYFNDLIKPLYGKKSSKRYQPGAAASPLSSPAIVPVSSRRGGVPPAAPWKNFGKSRSAAAVTGSPSPAYRVDESMQDGIQSAILHCKRSYNSSRESSLLSRSMSSSSQEKLSSSSSEDSWILSRLPCDSPAQRDNSRVKIEVTAS